MHTEPIFKILNILKIQDLYRQTLLKFYYKHQNDKLPYTSQNMVFNTSIDSHQYAIRTASKLRLPKVNHSFAKFKISYAVPEIVNQTSQNIIDKVSTHSYKGFTSYIKTMYLKEYKLFCNIPFCYICNNTENQPV